MHDFVFPDGSICKAANFLDAKTAFRSIFGRNPHEGEIKLLEQIKR